MGFDYGFALLSITIWIILPVLACIALIYLMRALSLYIKKTKMEITNLENSQSDEKEA